MRRASASGNKTCAIEIAGLFTVYLRRSTSKVLASVLLDIRVNQGYSELDIPPRTPAKSVLFESNTTQYR